MGGNKAVASDGGVVADVVSTPEHDIVTDSDKRLDNVVFEDEAMLTDLAVSPDESVGTDVGSRLVSLCFHRLVESRSQLIPLGIDIRREKVMVARSVPGLDRLQ